MFDEVRNYSNEFSNERLRRDSTMYISAPVKIEAIATNARTGVIELIKVEMQYQSRIWKVIISFSDIDLLLIPCILRFVQEFPDRPIVHLHHHLPALSQ